MHPSDQTVYWSPWTFRFDDDEKHLLTENATGSLLDFQSIIPIPRGKVLSSVTASCEWQDQRWGNCKGRMGVILLRGGQDDAATSENSSRRPPWPLVPQTSSHEPYSLAHWGLHRIRGRRQARDHHLARFSISGLMVEGSEVDLFEVVGHQRSAVRADLDGQSSAEFDEKILQR